MSQQKKPINSSYFCWCFHSADWKREEILDHSFSLINVNDYVNKSLVVRIKYLWIFFVVFKTVLVYMSDLYLLYSSFNTKRDLYEGKGKEDLYTSCNAYFENNFVESYLKNFKFICGVANQKSWVSYLVKNMFFLLLFSILITYVLSFRELRKAQKNYKVSRYIFCFY